MELRDFYVTFGQQYRREQHPKSINNASPHPDGWMVIEAHTAEEARGLALQIFDGRYAFLYGSLEDMRHELYPLGELTRIPYRRPWQRY